MEYQDFEDFKFALKNNMHFVIAYDENKNPLAYRAILVLKIRLGMLPQQLV